MGNNDGLTDYQRRVLEESRGKPDYFGKVRIPESCLYDKRRNGSSHESCGGVTSLDICHLIERVMKGKVKISRERT
ncbi:MAG: hypothetical protein ABIF88_01795 [archaeon]